MHVRDLDPPSSFSSMAPSPLFAILCAHMALAVRLPIQVHISGRQVLVSHVARDEDESRNDDDGDDDGDDYSSSNKGVELDPVHYYFILLLLLLITVGLLSWLLCWRRRRSRKSGRPAGEQARAMDAQDWTNCIPSNATLVRRNSNPAEYDDAPPPYHVKTDAAPPYPSIPLRTLPRDENDRSRPPHYTEHYGTRQEVV